MENFVQEIDKEIEVSSEKVLDSYKDRLEQADWYQEVRDIVVLGSYGRKDAGVNSDIDVWLVLNSTDDLSLISDIGLSDIKIRQDLSNETGYPNLGRHLASIFDPQEADLYRRIYLTRVGIPYQIGEQTSLGNGDSQSYFIDSKYRQIDFVVSLYEFLERDRDLISTGVDIMKWKRRLIQELTYYQGETRLRRKSDMDYYFNNVYQGNAEILHKSILDKVGEVRDCFEITEDEIQKTRILRTVVTTLEKVRWEFVYSWKDLVRYSDWLREYENRSHPERYAFVPSQIKDVVDKCEELFPSLQGKGSDLKDVLQIPKFERNPDDIQPERFYELYKDWSREILSSQKLA